MKIIFNGSENENLNNTIWIVDIHNIKKDGCVTCKDVIKYVYENKPEAHKSFFKCDGTLNNGTICLFEDQDISIINEDDAIFKNDSHLTFISTLHGG